MLKLSRKIDYALILLLHLSSQSHPISAQEIAKNYQLPIPMVAKILKELAHAEFVHSVRGKYGGYVLAFPLQKITLAHLIESIDTDFKLIDCLHVENCTCQIIELCPIRRPLMLLHEKIHDFLKKITLASLLSPQSENSHLKNRDYEISDLS